MATIEQRLRRIEERNSKVESDKAWETSLVRRSLIGLFTFIAIGAYLQAINVSNPWLNAIVPAIGFMLSTLTIPLFKQIWLNLLYKK